MPRLLLRSPAAAAGCGSRSRKDLTMPKPDDANTGRAGKHLVCAALELRGWEAELGDDPGARIEARDRKSGVGVTVRVNTIWHDRADVWPIADRDRLEDSPDPYEIHILVRLNGLDAVSEFFVVPRSRLVAAVTEQHDAWKRKPKADGTPRRSKLVTTVGFDEIPYRDRWDFLLG
jgi:hypothetical protein